MTDSDARSAVDAIVRDLRGRGALDHAWDSIDPDIREDIKDEWTRLIAANIDETEGGTADDA